MDIPEFSKRRPIVMTPDDLIDLLRTSPGTSCIINGVEDEPKSLLIMRYDKDDNLREYIITENVDDILVRLRTDVDQIMNRIDE